LAANLLHSVFSDMETPSISVVIPAYNAARTLELCLKSLRASERQPLECIVVDDGSTDATAEVVRRYGAKLISTGGRQGPAKARNRGAREAAGEVVFFVDADICLHPNTLSRVAGGFAAEPEIDAIIGSYDDSPEQQDVLSMYRNLMHRYVHQHSREEASTFWSGCGAIRRSVFLQHGGFDESYGRPAIEDIELGYRLSAAGHRIRLDRGLEVKHLKRWTFVNLVRTDIFDRGMPWTELILRDGNMPNDLNIQLSQRLSVALAFLLFGLTLACAIYYRGLFLVPVLALMLFGLACYWAETAVYRAGKGVKIFFAVLTATFTISAYTHHMRTLIPPVLVGYVLLLIRYRYGYRTEIARKVSGIAYAVYLIGSLVFIAIYLPERVPVLCFVLMLLAIVAINRNFYLFLGRRMGWLSALTAVPFHVLFYFYNGIAFLTGVVMYGLRWLRTGRYKAARGEIN
jgi:glycosyltransferase involved in cell wall biosynthesis